MIMARTTITRIRRRSLFERLFSLPWKPTVTTEETQVEIEVSAPLSPAAMAAARGMQNANHCADIMPPLTQNQRIDLANNLSAWLKASSCSQINQGYIMKDILDWARVRARK